MTVELFILLLMIASIATPVGIECVKKFFNKIVRSGCTYRIRKTKTCSIYNEIQKIQDILKDIQENFVDDRINTLRWRILDFSSGLSGGRK